MKLEFITVQDRSNGYGVSKDLFLRYFQEAGVEIISKFDDKAEKDISLVYSYPGNITWAHADKKVCFTMFETTKIPDSWVEQLEQFDLVIVPTKFCQDTFKRSGIDTKVINLGYDQEVFKHIERPERDTFTFLNYEAFTLRKGWHELFKAWQEAFGPEDNVKMIFKTVASAHGMNIPTMSQYPNIEVVNEELSQEGLNDLLEEADCFVFPSRGEGFGIPPLEAMATGIPVIAPNGHSISEYFNDKYMIDIKWKRIPAKYDFIKEDVGEFILCDIKDLVKSLRFAYDNKERYRKISSEISQYALQYTIRSAVNKLINVLEDCYDGNTTTGRDDSRSVGRANTR